MKDELRLAGHKVRKKVEGVGEGGSGEREEDENRRESLGDRRLDYTQ